MAANMRYMFIECQTPDEAKLRNTRGSKSAARAHVTKRQETFTADTTDSSPSPSSRSPPEVEIREEDNGVDVDADEDLCLEEIPIQSRERSPSISDPVARSVIRSTLSQSRTDPFNSLAIQDMSPFLQRVLDHALVHTWPSTVPAKGSLTLANPVNSAWLQSSLQYPVVLHAFLYAASLHLSMLCKAQEMASTCWLRFDQYRRAIALVNKHIRELEGPPSDALIMAVTTLAVHGRMGEVSRPECHPPSPLATQQYIHVYGQLLPEETHIQGLRMLLRRKGGIDKIETYGMAETLAL
jgi:hypothetical protein